MKLEFIFSLHFNLRPCPFCFEKDGLTLELENTFHEYPDIDNPMEVLDEIWVECTCGVKGPNVYAEDEERDLVNYSTTKQTLANRMSYVACLYWNLGSYTYWTKL